MEPLSQGLGERKEKCLTVFLTFSSQEKFIHSWVSTTGGSKAQVVLLSIFTSAILVDAIPRLNWCDNLVIVHHSLFSYGQFSNQQPG